MLQLLILILMSSFVAPSFAQNMTDNKVILEDKIAVKGYKKKTLKKIDLNKLIDEQQLLKKKRKVLEQKKLIVIPKKANLFEELMPWNLDKNLHPKVQENLIWIWIATIFLGDFAGPLWIPQLITGLEAGDGYTMDSLLFWMDHFLFALFSKTCLNCCCGVGSLVFLSHVFVNYPISMINFFNRSLLIRERDALNKAKKAVKCPQMKCPKLKVQKVLQCTAEKLAPFDLQKACVNYPKEMILPENIGSGFSHETKNERFAY